MCNKVPWSDDNKTKPMHELPHTGDNYYFKEMFFPSRTSKLAEAKHRTILEKSLLEAKNKNNYKSDTGT